MGCYLFYLNNPLFNFDSHAPPKTQTRQTQNHLDQVESGGTPGESKELRNAREKFNRVFGVSLGEEDRLVSGARFWHTRILVNRMALVEALNLSLTR